MPAPTTTTRSGGAARPRSFVGTDRERRGPALKLIKPSRRSAWNTGGSAPSSQMRCRPQALTLRRASCSEMRPLARRRRQSSSSKLRMAW